MITVLVVDDHEVLRRTLRDALNAAEGISVVGEAHDGAQGVAMAAALRPDVVLMDVRMPGMGGADATKAIKDFAAPAVNVVALSSSGEPESVAPMLAAGASGYLVKGDSPEKITRAIRRVHRGERLSLARYRDRLVQRRNMRGRNANDKPDRA